MSLKKTKNTEKKVAASTTTDAFTLAIIEAIQDVKGLDIIEIDLRNVHDASTDCFVICTGNSSTHIHGIADRIDKSIREQYGFFPNHIEGRQSKSWVLLDYFSVVVHIFSAEQRQVYALEQLWNDAPQKRHESETAEIQEKYWDDDDF